MNSGIRDATNLAWKLALVLKGSAGDRLLDSYDSERREHAATMVNFATRMRQMYSPRNHVTERVRAAAFRGAQKVPGARDYILQMKYKPMPRYTPGADLGSRRKRPGRQADDWFAIVEAWTGPSGTGCLSGLRTTSSCCAPTAMSPPSARSATLSG